MDVWVGRESGSDASAANEVDLPCVLGERDDSGEESDTLSQSTLPSHAVDLICYRLPIPESRQLMSRANGRKSELT